jgi:hypothetical protein
MSGGRATKLMASLVAGVVLGACGGGAVHVIGPGVTTSTQEGASKAAPRSHLGLPSNQPTPTSPSTSVPGANGSPTPVTPALSAQIASELSALDNSLSQADSDLSGNGTGGST